MTANVVKMSAKKKLLIALCILVGVVAIVVSSVVATVAYLTSSAAVSNVFTIGNVGITMTESKVNTNGELVDNGQTQVDTNTYHLVPNKTYTKDPTITVTPGSEKSYLFVLVRNDIEAIECKDATHATATDGNDALHNPTIAMQLAANGWAKYTKASTGWVYVYVGFNEEGGVKTTSKVDVSDAAKASGACDYKDKVITVNTGKYKLFDSFSIDEHANTSTYGAAKITLTAVAIQEAGFNEENAPITGVDAAWAAVVETYPYIHTGTAN